MKNSKKVKYFMGGAIAAGLTATFFGLISPRLRMLSILKDELEEGVKPYDYEDEYEDDYDYDEDYDETKES